MDVGPAAPAAAAVDAVDEEPPEGGCGAIVDAGREVEAAAKGGTEGNLTNFYGKMKKK